MATKTRRTRLTNLKRSFVVTIAASAAGISGCAGVHSEGDGSATMAGSGGGGSGGASGDGGTSGVGGGYVATNPPFVDNTCPLVEPAQDALCTSREPCTYDYPNIDPCFQTMRTIARCQNGQWVLVDSMVSSGISCNPPEIFLDASVDPGVDEDGGS